jgi:excisionase family DNA binding protein
MNDATPDDLGRFLTVADAAELLRIAPTEVLAVIRSGELPAIAVGSARSWRIERAALEGYIDALYEQSRRMALWNQAQFTEIVELTFGDSPRS